MQPLAEVVHLKKFRLRTNKHGSKYCTFRNIHRNDGKKNFLEKTVKKPRRTCAKQNDVDSDVAVQRLENLHGDSLSQAQRFSLHGLRCVQHDDDFPALGTRACVKLWVEDQHAGLEGKKEGVDEGAERRGGRGGGARRRTHLALLVGVSLHPHPGQVGLSESHGQLETLQTQDLSGAHAHHGLAVSSLPNK